MNKYFNQLLLISATLSISVPGYSIPLSPVELQIKNDVIQQQSKELGFLKKLVNINSGTENIKGVVKVGALLEKEFKNLGFKTRWFEEPASMHKAGTLIATREGKQGKRLLLIGHLDTVFGPKSTFQTYKRQGNYATGPGISDDKGGDVVILYALKALAKQNKLDNTSITIVLTGDEEESGKPASISRKPLLDAAKDKDIALDFEPSLHLQKASIGRRGITNWLLTSTGKEGHSSTILKKNTGAGAIFELTRILNTIRADLGHEKNLSFNPSLILGGTEISYNQLDTTGEAFGKHNVVAQSSIAHGDLRYLSEAQKNKARETIQNIVKQHLPETSAEVTFTDGIPPMEPTANNQKLLEIYSQASMDLGYGRIDAFDPGSKGAGDISYVAAIVPANLVGLGPVGEGQHSVNERMDIHSLEINTIRAAVLIYRLTR